MSDISSIRCSRVIFKNFNEKKDWLQSQLKKRVTTDDLMTILLKEDKTLVLNINKRYNNKKIRLKHNFFFDPKTNLNRR